MLNAKIDGGIPERAFVPLQQSNEIPHPPLNHGTTMQSFGIIPHGLSPGVLQSTGLNCIPFSRGPSNYPSASTSSGPTVLDMYTSTPARTSVPKARAQLPRTQLHFTETESHQTPSIQALFIQASSPSIQTPSSSPLAANQPEPAHHQTLPQPLPPVRQNTARCLDSCEIRNELLRPVDEVPPSTKF